MTLRLENYPSLRACARTEQSVPRALFMQLIRDSYPELMKQLGLVLTRTRETVNIEPGDVVLVTDEQLVMQRDPVIRRRILRRDEERDTEPREPGAADEGEGAGEIWKELDAPRNGTVTVIYDRGYYGQTVSPEQRTGRIEITCTEPLGAASRELQIRQPTEALRLELAEAFATRSVPLALNGFFGVRAFLVAPDTILLTRPDLHGTDRLQELLKNPSDRDSEHMLADIPTRFPESFRLFEEMREHAYRNDDRRVERRVDDLPRPLVRELLTAIAVPQIHGTIGNLLRMQFAFLQPHTIIGATSVSAGPALQLAWDPLVQLRILDAVLTESGVS